MTTHDLPAVEPFVRTAELSSFRGAAARLGITPAAVSKAVARLEDALGVRLLNRTTRSVSLTPEGEVFLAHARTALDALQAGRDQVSRSQETPQGLVRVSVTPVFGRALAQALHRLVLRHPRLELQLEVTDRRVRLVEDAIDVAVRMGELGDSSLIARRLRTPRRVLVSSPSWLGRRGTPGSVDDLSEQLGVLFRAPDGLDVPWVLRDGDGLQTVRPARVVHVDQGERVVEAVEAGLGLCQAPDVMVDDAVAAGRLIEVLPERAPPGPPVHALIVPERRSVPAVRVVIEWLVEVLG